MIKKLLTSTIPKSIGIFSVFWVAFKLIQIPALEPITIIRFLEITLCAYAIIFLIIDLKKEVKSYAKK